MLAVSFAAAFLAAGVSTWTGFGSATILTPVLASFLDLRSTILVVAVFHGLANALKTVTFRDAVAWRVVLLFGPAAVVFSVLGGLLSAVAPVSALKVALGILLVFDASTGLAGAGGAKPWRAGAVHAGLGGAASGLAAGVIGTGGAVRAFFLHHFIGGKAPYVATSAAIATLIDASRVPVYLSLYDEVDIRAVWPLMLVTAAAGFAGVYLARALLPRIRVERFRKVVLASLLLAGAWFLVDGAFEWAEGEPAGPAPAAVYISTTG